MAKTAPKKTPKKVRTPAPGVILDKTTLKQALVELAAADPDIARALAEAGHPELREMPTGYGGLMRSIVGQQVSVHAARSIWLRLEAAVPSMLPADFLAMSDEQLRAVGLSGAKMKYGRSLASDIVEGRIGFDTLHELDDAAAIAMLTQAKGIGPWTAEIYLMFAHGRPDIMPGLDLGLVVAAQHLKGLRKRPDAKRLLKIAEAWRPWRSAAALVLWHYRRNMPDWSAKEKKMTKKLDGPSHGPHAGGKPGHLVILLHGYGADGNDLIGLAPVLAPLMPDAVFHSPNAPYPCEGNPMGFQWFGISRLDPEVAAAGVRSAAPFAEQFIDDTMAKYGLDESKTVLIGFSQGTMMALHVGLRREKQLAGIVGFSGMLAGPDALKAEIKSKPPVLLVHGDSDEMLPAVLTQRAAKTLKENGVEVAVHIAPGVGHGIDQTGLSHCARFVLEAFKLPVPQQ